MLQICDNNSIIYQRERMCFFMKIGNRIKLRRKELNMSAEELGKRLGKDRSTIYRYENGDIENMPLDILPELAAALDMSQQQLMGWESEEELQKTKEKIFGNDLAEIEETADVISRMNKEEGFRKLILKINKLNPDEYAQIMNLTEHFISKNHSS